MININIKVKNDEISTWPTKRTIVKTKLLFTKLRVPKPIIAALLALVFLLPQNIHAQAQNQAQSQWSNYKNVKNWTINRYTNSQSSPTASCSAVKFIDRSNAIRIERVSDGFIFGLNGYSREQNGTTFPMSFWFDGKRGGKQSGQASFFKDAGYEFDDWLSFFVPLEARWGTLASIKNGVWISFEVSVPGNRTGNDLVVSNFSLSGSTAAILALEECYQIANNSERQRPAVPMPLIVASSDCPDDGPRLSGSGICQGRGVNYLEFTVGEAPLLSEGCEWKLNETRMPEGDYLLYLAAACKGVITELEFSSGAHLASVAVVKSALDGGEVFVDLMNVVPLKTANPQNEVLKLSRQQVNDPSEAAKCRIVNYTDEPSDDRFTIEKYSLEEITELAQDGPLDDRCGRFGTYGEITAYWRIFGGYAWFIKLQDDAYQDIDPRSLTVVKAADLPSR